MGSEIWINMVFFKRKYIFLYDIIISKIKGDNNRYRIGFLGKFTSDSKVIYLGFHQEKC